MKIGILSDTHDHRANTLAALAIFRAEGVSQLLHCGDITTPGLVAVFAGWPITFVTGNMDRQLAELADAARAIGAMPPREQVSLTLDGHPIALLHGHHDEVLQNLVEAQTHRYVLHGHTHQRRDDRVGQTRVINPGAVGGTRRGPRSVAVLDVANDDLRFIEIEEKG